MSKRAKYVGKHRAAPTRTAPPLAPKQLLGSTALLSSVAVVATGAAVVGGVAATGPAAISNAAADAGAQVPGGTDGEPEVRAADLGEREVETVSRSDTRTQADPAKRAALSSEAGGAMTRTEDLSQSDPRDIARALLGDFGFGQDQFGCLDSLYMRESGWSVTADNPTSSAYGIPQALPGSKMASAGADWETNPVTQIEWGLGYIQDRYGSPCGAWAHSQSHGWY